MKQRNSTNGSETKKFKLPNIFGPKSLESSHLLRPIKFNNLSELASAHLSADKNPPLINSKNASVPQETQRRTKFVIPKLSGGSSASLMSSNLTNVSPTPHELSLQKIMDLKRLHISSNHTTADIEAAPNFENPEASQPFESGQSTSIDLACALNNPNFHQSIIPAVKPLIEEIKFKFIDCDISEKLDHHSPSVSQDCNLNMLDILDRHFEKRTKCTTSFGRILCSKYKRKQQPLIQHGFINKHQLKPFNFDLKMKRIN